MSCIVTSMPGLSMDMCQHSTRQFAGPELDAAIQALANEALLNRLFLAEGSMPLAATMSSTTRMPGSLGPHEVLAPRTEQQDFLAPPPGLQRGPVAEAVPPTALAFGMKASNSEKSLHSSQSNSSRNTSNVSNVSNRSTIATVTVDVKDPATQTVPRMKKKGRLSTREVMAKGITTVMMHQIGHCFTQDMLLQCLNKEGFKGAYDYVYLPVGPDGSATSRGYAFINMCSPDLAAALVSKWSGSKAFSAGEEGSPGIFFSMAAVQGFDANVMQITQGKLHRNRRQRFLPFVAGDISTSL
mmetsp:Transcript_23998/g.55401  ORF Transcript_23998/g.55401 Transcript_23998/m.55401 type:complete len:298 (-) Transcript_23998:99-992(-)